MDNNCQSCDICLNLVDKGYVKRLTEWELHNFTSINMMFYFLTELIT